MSCPIYRQQVLQYGILDFGIRLDKNRYEAGETANGTLLTESDIGLKVRKLRFLVCGKERYEAGMSGGMSTGGISGDHSHSSENYDIFSLRT